MFIDDSPVCDDHWDTRDGEVVCRQLGFSGLARVTSNSHFGSVPSSFVMDDVECNGDEDRLEDCSATWNYEDNCSGSEGAGVVCLTGDGKYRFPSAPPKQSRHCSSLVLLIHLPVKFLRFYNS